MTVTDQKSSFGYDASSMQFEQDGISYDPDYVIDAIRYLEGLVGARRVARKPVALVETLAVPILTKHGLFNALVGVSSQKIAYIQFQGNSYTFSMVFNAIQFYKKK